MAGALVIGVAAVAVAWFWGRRNLAAWPSVFAVAWFASPAVALWASLSPRVAGRRPLAEADAHALRLIARRTWRFFETFVTPADNMLPPDNFQEDPEPGGGPPHLADQYRPLSAVGGERAGFRLDRDPRGGRAAGGDARDHGSAWPSTAAIFFNWYDTRDLRPLDPQYVSSVDSGNLAGHLIALANACREWREPPLGEQQRIAGRRRTRSTWPGTRRAG